MEEADRIAAVPNLCICLHLKWHHFSCLFFFIIKTILDHSISPKFQSCNCITHKNNWIQVAHYSRTRGQIYSGNVQAILTEFNCLRFNLFPFLKNWVVLVFSLQAIYMGRFNFKWKASNNYVYIQDLFTVNQYWTTVNTDFSI